MTHYMYITQLLKAGKFTSAVQCNAGHITFGGRCLNCGYDPDKHSAESASVEK